MSNKVTGNEPAYAFDTNFEGKLYRGMTLRQKALLEFMKALVQAGSMNTKSVIEKAEELTTAYINQLNKET